MYPPPLCCLYFWAYIRILVGALLHFPSLPHSLTFILPPLSFRCQSSGLCLITTFKRNHERREKPNSQMYVSSDHLSFPKASLSLRALEGMLTRSLLHTHTPFCWNRSSLVNLCSLCCCSDPWPWHRCSPSRSHGSAYRLSVGQKAITISFDESY